MDYLREIAVGAGTGLSQGRACVAGSVGAQDRCAVYQSRIIQVLRIVLLEDVQKRICIAVAAGLGAV